jgi:hypothetical protein
LQLCQRGGKDRRLGSDETLQVKWIASGQFDPRRMSLGKLEDIGGFLAEIPLAAKAPRHRHDIGCGGTDHLDLAVVQ